MNDSIHVDAYACAGMAAVASAHRWSTDVRPDGTIQFAPPRRQSDATK